MARQLFGTDGVRGKANHYPLEPNLVLRMGQTLGWMIRQGDVGEGKNRVFIGYDTRLSGPMISSALTAGLLSQGVTVEDLGVCTTPGVAYICTKEACDVGLVISASHNPHEDNGIKLFNNHGMKVADEKEEAIEAVLLGDRDFDVPDQPGTLNNASEMVNQFIIEMCKGFDFKGWGPSFLVDCANGAAHDIFSRVAKRTNLATDIIHASPNGININKKCGSTHLNELCAMVKAGSYDGGFAFDGDADRVLFVDHEGSVVDGDYIMAILARQMKADGELAGHTVVGTIMSNLGLEVSLKDENVTLKRASVGDKYVLEEMLKGGYKLGGEKSGHIINLHKSTTGDGILTALSLLASLQRSGESLQEAASVVQESPQVLLNVKVKEKVPFAKIPGVSKALAEAESKLADQGRVVLRYSGTEGLARVMVEGFDADLVNTSAQAIAGCIQNAIGL